MQKLTDWEASERFEVWLPDGAGIIYQQDNSKLMVLTLDGSINTPLTDWAGQEFFRGWYYPAGCQPVD